MPTSSSLVPKLYLGTRLVGEVALCQENTHRLPHATAEEAQLPGQARSQVQLGNAERRRRSVFLLGVLMLLAVPPRCPASINIVISGLAYDFSLIQKRVGPDMVLPFALSIVEVDFRGFAGDAEHKRLGPAADGFIFQAEMMSNLTTFKPAQHPFAWEGYPEKDKYPWNTEFHIFSLGRGEWLVVSVWSGPSTDKELISELLAATSKTVEETRKHNNP